MQRILIVDDEERMVDLIALFLMPHGYTIYKASTGFEALEKIKTDKIDLVLLDVMMPEMDGWTTCKEIRSMSDVPIIMLTARDQSNEIVKGLKLGADDYITKPFDEDVLLARIEAITRRFNQVDKNTLVMNGLMWEMDKHRVSYKGKTITMTPIEFNLLGLFMRNSEKVFSRAHLIQLIWGFESNTEGRTIDSHIRNLREKCRQSGFQIEGHLKTIWGVGYKWKN
ncbi:response regulator transcription factor (plasmid) [Alkalihalobacillus hwajinpoensis]|uniref:response regulator transcription factor n=1 Tax=Guptibacillus hwajinpoensis TaxID=208199 RepID=UPI001883AB85|nr:response regulator transcription factor [Pseudalkalibacillus hwajinpoensis]MBF0706680.1 response regulator transcription factor [Pseudalkalibacillus hwajinpoensis]